MGWRVVYLDKKCRVCQEIGRNVIEPVAVFLKENQRLEDLTEEELKKFDTCIFHCEKENGIWMESVEEYRQWKERRDKALKEVFKEVFNENIIIIENIEIRCGKNLVDEFWRRVRAYRFAVDYVDLWKKSEENWDKFIQNLRSSNIDGKPLTFIVGNYGMNFDNMPELHTKHGYFIVTGVNIVVAFFIFIWLKRKKWI